MGCRGQLQVELERTMALCLVEQQKNAQLEEKRKREDPHTLQLSVAQQRASLVEAQVAPRSDQAVRIPEAGAEAGSGDGFRRRPSRRRCHAAESCGSECRRPSRLQQETGGGG